MIELIHLLLLMNNQTMIILQRIYEKNTSRGNLKPYTGEVTYPSRYGFDPTRV